MTVAENLTKMRDAARGPEAAIKHRPATPLQQPEAWFVQQRRGQPPASRAPLVDLLEVNRDDEELCAWLRTAKVGEEMVTGGGAAPVRTVRRVS